MKKRLYTMDLLQTIAEARSYLYVDRETERLNKPEGTRNNMEISLRRFVSRRKKVLQLKAIQKQFKTSSITPRKI